MRACNLHLHLHPRLHLHSQLRPLLLGAAILAASLSVGAPAYAFGDAPWCAIIGLGPGDVYYDCQYRTFEECAPHVIAGNRGFCGQNPWPGPAAATPRPRRRRDH